MDGAFPLDPRERSGVGQYESSEPNQGSNRSFLEKGRNEVTVELVRAHGLSSYTCTHDYAPTPPPRARYPYNTSRSRHYQSLCRDRTGP